MSQEVTDLQKEVKLYTIFSFLTFNFSFNFLSTKDSNFDSSSLDLLSAPRCVSLNVL